MGLGLVVVAISSYVFTGLRFGTIVEERADRLAAADGGLRYGIERLTLQSYAGCISGLGDSGYTIDFPGQVNGTDVEVTCQKVNNAMSTIQGWAIVVTGEGVPVGSPELLSQAGGGLMKLLGGPVYVSNPSETLLKAPVTVEDGDIWYTAPTGSSCADPAPTIDTANLKFTPKFRGLICAEQPWDELFTEPVQSVPTYAPADPTTSGTCKVFHPGKYTSMPTLASQNYFMSGEYYFENFTFKPEATDAQPKVTVIAGWANADQYGDQQFLPAPDCEYAAAADQASGSASGATIYLGGTARIDIGNKGALEIMRRLQGNSLVSVHALETNGAGYLRSSLTYADDIMTTANGTNHDMAIHGLIWAPRSSLTFGTVTNSANGQLLGGAVFAQINLKASASASGFIIRVEPSPIAFSLMLESTATLNGRSTTMRAIVQVNDVGVTATNSWRVTDSYRRDGSKACPTQVCESAESSRTSSTGKAGPLPWCHVRFLGASAALGRITHARNIGSNAPALKHASNWTASLRPLDTADRTDYYEPTVGVIRSIVSDQ